MMNRDLSYWEDLAERYFEAETTEEEETLLRKFLCTDEACDPRFDEVRATMAYIYVASAPTAPSPLPLWGSALKRRASGIVAPLLRGSGEGAVGAGLRTLLAAVAACFCIAAFLGWQEYRQYNISTVRMAGEDVEADASLLMQQQMTEMFNPIDPSER